MRLRLLLILAAFAALLVIGASAAGANRGGIARVAWFEDPQQDPGAVIPGSYVVQQRGYFSITAQMHLKGLTPGHRYTLLWVVYNDPAACVQGCDMDDISAALATGANPAGIGVHFGGSFVIGPTGNLAVSTRILEDSLGGCQTSRPYVALCEALADAAVAQAAILIHDQGPAVASTAPAAIAGAFANGCQSYQRHDTVVAVYAAAGYACFTPQAVHLP